MSQLGKITPESEESIPRLILNRGKMPFTLQTLHRTKTCDNNEEMIVVSGEKLHHCK